MAAGGKKLEIHLTLTRSFYGGHLLCAFGSGLKNLVGVVFRVYFLDDVLYPAFFIDDKSYPGRAHVFSSVHGFFDPGSIGLVNASVSVGQQAEGQLFFFNKLLVHLFAVGADAKDFISAPYHARIIVAQVAGFRGASGSHVFRVKVQHYFLTLQGRKFDSVPVLIIHGEVGSFIACL